MHVCMYVWVVIVVALRPSTSDLEDGCTAFKGCGVESVPIKYHAHLHVS